VIVDEQPMARESLRRVLERDGFAVVAESADAGRAVEVALRERPDLCVIDVLLAHAKEAILEIAAEAPGTSIVVLTDSHDRGHFFDALRAGAVGYLLKNMDPERIPHALRGVLAGEAAIPRTLVASLVSEFRTQGRRRLVVGRRGRAELTRREWEVAELMLDGLETQRIGKRLYLSPITVRRHVSSIVGKLGVRDRGEAVDLLRRGGGGTGAGSD
jgi:DNA-binding NarL/FixJ family response regulator